jgi:hypothetical protein
MNDTDDEITPRGPAAVVASLNSLDVAAESDTGWSVDVHEPTVMPLIAVRGHLHRIGVSEETAPVATLKITHGSDNTVDDPEPLAEAGRKVAVEHRRTYGPLVSQGKTAEVARGWTLHTRPPGNRLRAGA